VADRCGIGFGQFISTLMSAACLLLLLSPSLDVQILGMMCYALANLLVYALYFSNIG